MRTGPSVRSESQRGEAAAKAAYLNLLRQSRVINRKTVLANELMLARSGVRADLAIFAGEFIGVEIKTERDSLRRLERQLAGYRVYCNRLVLILAEKHLKSSALPPLDDAELWKICSDGSVKLVREASCVKPRSVDVVPLLTAVEQRHLGRKDRATAGGMSPEDKQRAAFMLIASRFADTSATFWRAVGRRQIGQADLALLSRFRAAREEAANQASLHKSTWDAWEAQARVLFGDQALESGLA